MPESIYFLKQLSEKIRLIRIGFMLIPDFPLMTSSAALDSLRQGNRLAKRKVFEWVLISVDGKAVKSSSGLGFEMDAAMAVAPRCDVVIACAATNYTEAYDPAIFAWFRRLYSEGCILGAVSTAVFFFAKAGLPEGRRCAVHWNPWKTFAESFPIVWLRTISLPSTGEFCHPPEGL